MAKVCQCEECSNPVFSHNYCRFHQALRTDEKWLKTIAKNKQKGRDSQVAKAVKRNSYIIPKFSAKRLSDLVTYRPIRDEYQKEHPICEVHDCDKPANNLHHKMGRIGFADDWARFEGIKLLWDVRFFMNCCETCHPQRIHENSEWAYKNGYLISKI